MAQMIFSKVGQAIGGGIGALVGAGLGAAADKSLVNSLALARQVGPRLNALHVAQGAQNDPMVQVFGRARVAATLIWATRFKEHRNTKQASKNSPKTEHFSYSLSFALGLCAGPIDGIGRIWVDGTPIDSSQLNYRLYVGDETQRPDTLIEAIESDAPAYRGTAYMVFEDFDLTAFGNRLPNFSVEIFRRPKGAFDDLESKITSVCMIPGAGEFVYATTEMAALKGLTEASPLTRHAGDGQNDFLLALDQLQTQLPHVTSVNLVVSWFGTDLRASHCVIKPGVERQDTITTPQSWSVSGLDRQGAHLISSAGPDQRPAYGGTPSDRCVIEAIRELKRRGFSVTLVPFILMDIAQRNNLPDPYGGAEQGAYPWRGRITCDIEPNRAGTADKTAQIQADIDAFVGVATAQDFAITGDEIIYSGAAHFGFGRFILHMAALSVAAGGVESILLGSELRGLTTLRASAGDYPFVTALKRLAAEVRSVVGAQTKISYGADWSEYGPHHPDDGRHDLWFHLDPLWSDEHIDFIGLDWYAPATDWRDGTDHLDAQAGFGGPYDLDYLQSRIGAGEGYDFYYASDADRVSQIRTPIIDTAYNEDWVFRPKALSAWWQNAHFNRHFGVRSATPTPWQPQSKPIRFIEYGCAAIDKGANAPNRFLDPKSAESAVPYFSNGQRDDVAQSAYLSAFADYYAAHNPISSVYGEPMVAGMSVWCWDARPYPYFPARSDLWGDAQNWLTGHWLNGRVGSGSVKNLISEIIKATGLSPQTVDLSSMEGQVDSFVIERPMPAREALSPLLSYLGAEVAQARDKLVFSNLSVQAAHPIDPEQLADFGQNPVWQSHDMQRVPAQLSLRCYDLDRDYQILGLSVRESQQAGASRLMVDLPLGLGQTQARQFANNLLQQAQASRQEVRLNIDPLLAATLEVGDKVQLGADPSQWRIAMMEHTEQPNLSLVPWVETPPPGGVEPAPMFNTNGTTGSWITHFRMIDLPPLYGEKANFAPLLVATASPFLGIDIYAGASINALRKKGQIETPIGVGYVLGARPSTFGAVRQVEAYLDIYIENDHPVSKTWDEVFSGENFILVQSRDEAWEVIQYQSATLSAANHYRLKGLVRGQWGTEAAFAAGFNDGATVLRIEGAVVRAEMGLEALGLNWLWRAGVSGFSGTAQKAKDIDFLWTGKSLVPRAPVHGKILGQFGQSMRLSFLRASRSGGDSFDHEPLLNEDLEQYRLQFFQGETRVREVEIAQTVYDYSPTQQAQDYPSGFDGQSKVKIAQNSSIVGYGRELVVGLR